MKHEMTAAVKTLQGKFEVKDVDMPEIPHPDWVIVKVKVVGICGTDLRHWKKEDPEAAGKIMGHELAGEIVEVGDKVTRFRKGDRVVVETLLGDERCDWCRIQQYNVCPHLYEVRAQSVSRAFASYVIAPARRCYKLPDHVSFEEAALLDTFSVCLHAIQLSGIRLNDKVVVIGAGCIGLGQLQLAKASGADVVVVDVVESALDMAKELGADMVINPEREDARQKVMEFTGNRGADIVFECAGGSSMPKTLPQATSFARISGKVVVVGGFDPGKTEIGLEWERMQMGEIQFVLSASYSYWGIYPEMQMSLDLLAKGKINARKMITHHFPLSEINQAFETAEHKKDTHAIFVALTV